MLKNISGTVVLSACLVTACSGAAEVKPAASPAAPTPAAAQTQEDAIVARARAALRGAGIDDAVLRSMTPKQWNDSSLGCPRKGVSYLQVITHGHVVQFDTPMGPRSVNVAGENTVICTQQLSGVPKQRRTAIRATTLEAMLQKAREDLADKLGVPVDQVKVVSSLPFTWDAPTFRCGRPAAEEGDSRDTVTGYQVQLRSGTEQYVYFTDAKTVFPCPAIEKD